MYTASKFNIEQGIVIALALSPEICYNWFVRLSDDFDHITALSA